MLEFMMKYLPLISGLGTTLAFLVKLIAMSKSTKIEKQLESNVQRTIRDIMNICLLFISFWVVILSLYLAFNYKGNPDVINFSVSNLKYHASGNISNKKTKSIIFIVDGRDSDKEYIDVKEQKYDVKINQVLIGGEKYVLQDENQKDILTGIVPAKNDIDKKNDNYLIYFCLIMLMIIVYFYYGLKDAGYKKKLIFKNEGEFYIILKSINRSSLLLQKVEKNKDNLYVFKNIFKILEKTEINNKDLEYENSEDVKRRRYITTYISLKGLSWCKIIIFAIFIIILLGLLDVYFGLIGIGFMWSAGIEIAVIITILIFATYQKSLYKKGKDIVMKEEDNKKEKK